MQTFATKLHGLFKLAIKLVSYPLSNRLQQEDRGSIDLGKAPQCQVEGKFRLCAATA